MKRKYFAALLCLLFVGLLPACTKEAQSQQNISNPAETTPQKIIVKTDKKSIEAGKTLFTLKCEYCHDAYSTMKLVGPGLKGILKNPVLPASKNPATTENIAKQMRHPHTNMPSFAYLSDDDVQNIIAFLNTL
jgi:cytochrome c2